MAIDGTYGIVYCGFTGLGIGVFTVSDGRLEGRDWDGTRYTGAAVETAEGNIVLNLSQEVPRDVGLVSGASPQDVPYGLAIQEEVPPRFGDGRPLEFGTVTVMVKQIPDDYLTRPTSQWSRLGKR